MKNMNNEGRILVNYLHKETKLEEFIANFHLVSDLLTREQESHPVTLQRFLTFADGLKVGTEEEANIALERLEEFVWFHKQDIELLKKVKNQKLEKRVEHILFNYDLRGKIGLIKKELLKEDYWAEEERLVLIMDGFGAEPNKIGRRMSVTYLSDFEETIQYRDDLECIFCDDVNALLTEEN